MTPECGPDITPTPAEQVIAYFDDDASSPNTACFTDTGITGGGWNGDFSFFQDTITDVEIDVQTLDTQNKLFDVHVTLPSCESPSTVPTSIPSQYPSQVPSMKPSQYPSDYPSMNPSQVPSMKPSQYPSDEPSMNPSQYPSDYPSMNPSDYPSLEPSQYPSDEPSMNPTIPPV